MARLILALLFVLLLVPSSNLQRFDGLPLSAPLEFAALVLLVPLVVSRSLRRLHRRLLDRAGRLARGVLVGGLLLALAAKLALLASGAFEGFLACYSTPLSPAPTGSCERSWENPFARHGITRLDRHIDVTPRSLNLSFRNSSRFNFPAARGRPSGGRLPLEATWRGGIEHGKPWTARITYIGQATVTIGTTTRELAAHHDAPATVRIQVPAGLHGIAVWYRFDDGYRWGQPAPPRRPYATFRLTRERSDGTEAPVSAVRPHRGWRILAGAADILMALLVAAAVLPLVPVVAAAWPMLLPGAIVGGLWWWPGLASRSGVGTAVRAALGLLLVLMLASNRARARVALWASVMLLALVLAYQLVGDLNTVVYRSAGDDWLTYESFARTILETWSLQGGEDVFYYQPLFRYVRFGQRLLLGDGDLLVLAAGLSALFFSVLWATGRLAGQGPRAPVRTAAIVGVGLLLLTLLSSATVVGAVLAPLSEQVTWIALPLLFVALVAGRSRRAWAFGAALAGLSVATRPNQVPALFLIVLTGLLAAWRRRPSAAVVAALLFGACALIPLAHNLYYGGQWILFTNARSIKVALAQSSVRLLASSDYARGLELAWADFQHVLLLVPTGNIAVHVAGHGLQLAWAFTVVWAVRARARLSGSTLAIVALPLGYLAVHLVFEVRDYYPRHLIAAYIAMGLAALYAAGRSPLPR